MTEEPKRYRTIVADPPWDHTQMRDDCQSCQRRIWRVRAIEAEQALWSLVAWLDRRPESEDLRWDWWADGHLIRERAREALSLKSFDGQPFRALVDATAVVAEVVDFHESVVGDLPDDRFTGELTVGEARRIREARAVACQALPPEKPPEEHHPDCYVKEWTGFEREPYYWCHEDCPNPIPGAGRGRDLAKPLSLPREVCPTCRLGRHNPVAVRGCPDKWHGERP